MKKVLTLLPLILLLSCSKPKFTLKKGIFGETKMKHCINSCIKDQFGMFHNKGESWGTGSSSMNGLIQSKIYDRVREECVKFMQGEKCCTIKYLNIEDDYDNIDYYFKEGYGTCKVVTARIRK